MRLALVTICVALLAAEAAHAGCGYEHRRPAGGRVGTAPLTVGDSVSSPAVERLARAGFEVDARCACSVGGGR